MWSSALQNKQDWSSFLGQAKRNCLKLVSGMKQQNIFSHGSGFWKLKVSMSVETCYLWSLLGRLYFLLSFQEFLGWCHSFPFTAILSLQSCQSNPCSPSLFFFLFLWSVSLFLHKLLSLEPIFIVFVYFWLVWHIHEFHATKTVSF